MDYRTLANAAAPGQSPLGSGIVDPIGYNRWLNLSNIQQQALQKAMPLADMDAQRQEQAMKEYMAGASGRMNQTTLANMTAEAGVTNFKEDQARKKLQEQLQDSKIRTELADYTLDIGKDGDGYINAKDEEQKEALRISAKGKKVRLPNGSFYVMGTDEKQDRAWLLAAGMSRASAPTVQVKRDVEDKKIAGRMEYLKRKGATDADLVRLRAQMQRDVAEAKANMASKKPLTESQQEAIDLLEAYPDVEDRLMYRFLKKKAGAGEQKLETGAETAEQFGIPTAKPEKIVPPPVTKKSSTKQQVPFNGKGVVDLDLDDFNRIETNESVWLYGKDKKSKVVKKQFNSETGEYRLILKDGTTIQNKFKGR